MGVVDDPAAPTPDGPADPGRPTEDGPAGSGGGGTGGGGTEGEDSDAAAPADPHRRRRWILIGVFALVGAGVVSAMFLIRLPYYLIQPGSVRPSENRIDISGAKSYENDGEVLFTTVYVDQATPALMIRAWLDDAVDVRTRAEMYPDDNRKEVQKENFVRMDLSKLTATRVALDHLGIDATYDADGSKVVATVEGGPSEGVLLPGDVITAVDGAEVGLPSSIAPELADHAPGDAVAVTVQREVDGAETEKSLQVTLGAASDDPSRPVLGIEAEPVDPRIDSPVQVTVDSGSVSGPSAGLAWTLGIIDRLTPGSLTDGRRVAVTGEILDDGTVGPIGGIEQKVAAVKRAGVDLFIYPASTPEAEQKAMRRIAGDQVELRPVANIDEAVAVLAPQGLDHPG